MNEKEETKGELLEVTGFEGINLANAIVQLCHASVPKMEREANIDKEYIELVKKSRQYIELILGKATLELKEKK